MVCCLLCVVCCALLVVGVFVVCCVFFCRVGVLLFDSCCFALRSLSCVHCLGMLLYLLRLLFVVSLVCACLVGV